MLASELVGELDRQEESMPRSLSRLVGWICDESVPVSRTTRSVTLALTSPSDCMGPV